jgi:hypothetical protein
MQVLREHEDRDQNSKEMSSWRMYEALQHSDLVQRFGYKEIDTTVQLKVRPQDEIKESDKFLFKRVGATASQPLMKGILANQDWPTWNAQTLRRVPSEVYLARKAFVLQDPLYLTKAWVAGLLPMHQAILHHPPDGNAFIFFTVSVHQYVVLGWPVRRKGVTSFSLDVRETATPSWTSFPSLDHLYVIPSFPKGPASVAAEMAEIPIHEVACVWSHVAKVPVAEWQANHGFANCSELSMHSYHAELGLDLPAGLESGNDPSDVLALNLCSHYIKDLTEPLAKHIMTYRAARTDAALESDFIDAPIDIEAMLDVGERKDMKAANDYGEELKQNKVSAAKHRVSCLAAVTKKFVGVKKAKKVVCPIATKAKELKLHTVAGKTRWWASLVGDKTYIDEFRPPTGRVAVDDANGRFLVTYSGGKRKSVSWTKVGLQAASVNALALLWGWHHEATDEICPLPLG